MDGGINERSIKLVMLKPEIISEFGLNKFQTDDNLKSAFILRIEKKFNADIRDILSRPLSHRKLARILEVDKSTISRWRKQFNQIDNISK